MIDRLASQCVKCGLCLPHCPTYTLTQDENESPRGRIALFQALSNEQLPHTAHVKNHLDQCLGCRACEAVCPAGVRYGELLTLGRALQNTQPVQNHPPSRVIQLLHTIVQYPFLQRFFHRLLWLMQITGIRSLARKSGLAKIAALQRLEALLPWVKRPQPPKKLYPAIGNKKGTVMLFTGCTDWCDQETRDCSIFVLQRLGLEVVIPSGQGCCGAISAHAGKLAQAESLAQKNAIAFASDTAIPIITLATGCGSFLGDKSYPTDFSARCTDIMRFLCAHDWPSDLSLQPLPLHIKLHTPCTRRYVLKTPDDPAQLLSTIPQLMVSNFKTTTCCGAAGTYMLEHPTLAGSLADTILSELDNTAIDYIATSNVGCALHLQQQLRNLASSIPLVHPVVLLARALGYK